MGIDTCVPGTFKWLSHLPVQEGMRTIMSCLFFVAPEVPSEKGRPTTHACGLIAPTLIGLESLKRCSRRQAPQIGSWLAVLVVQGVEPYYRALWCCATPAE